MKKLVLVLMTLASFSAGASTVITCKSGALTDGKTTKDYNAFTVKLDDNRATVIMNGDSDMTYDLTRVRTGIFAKEGHYKFVGKYVGDGMKSNFVIVKGGYYADIDEIAVQVTVNEYQLTGLDCTAN